MSYACEGCAAASAKRPGYLEAIFVWQLIVIVFTAACLRMICCHIGGLKDGWRTMEGPGRCQNATAVQCEAGRVWARRWV